MKGRIKKCKRCGRYTLREDKCPYCGGKLISPHPPRYSPEDKYGKYRRDLKLRLGICRLRDDI